MMAESSYVPILEIRDEFVTCEICLEYFGDGEKCPRILPCHHSFCCQCLLSLWNNSQQGVTCPNCRHVWPVRNSIEATFSQNKVLSNLVEYIALKNKKGDTICHECPNDSKATFRCLDCQQYMCQGCTACHRKFTTTKTHETVLITELTNMPQDQYFQQKEMCENHENFKLEIFCKGCSTPVCPNCALVSHKDHDICNLKDVYNEKKDFIRAGLKDLQVSEEKLKAFAGSLAVDNQTVAETEQTILNNIHDKSSKIIAKVMEIATQLKEDIISRAAKQKALRNEQIELITQSESVKADHLVHCQQALQFARQVEFIEMSDGLDNETKKLMKTPELPELEIEEISADLNIFEQLDHILQQNEILDDKSKIRPCIELMDAAIGKSSTVLTVTLLATENTKENNPVVIQATIEPLQEEKQNEQRLKTVTSTAGSLQYKPDTTGSHKTSISINGRPLCDDRFVFHTREQDKELMRKIFVGIDGEPGEHRDIGLPTVKFDDSKINRTYCDITESGLLVNKYSFNPTLLPPDSLKSLRGVTARSPLSELGCFFWVTRVECKVLPPAELSIVAAQAGICLEEHCDDEVQIANNEHSWCFSVGSCETHNSLCLKVFARGNRVCDIPLAMFKPNTKVNITLGLLLDNDNSTLHVINVTTKSQVHSIPNIDTSQPLMPVFSVYVPHMFEVKLSVQSSMDLSMDPALLMLLSSLVQP